MHLAPCSLPSALPSCPQWRCGAALTCCHLGNCCQSERACWDGWPELAAGRRAAAGDVTDAPLRTNRPLSLSPSHRSVWLVDPSPLRDAPWDRTLVKSNVQAYGEKNYCTLMFTFLHVDTLKRSQRAKPHSDLGYPDTKSKMSPELLPQSPNYKNICLQIHVYLRKAVPMWCLSACKQKVFGASLENHFFFSAFWGYQVITWHLLNPPLCTVVFSEPT